MRTKNVFLLAALPGFALLNQSAQAGGIGLYEIGTPDVGLASAGYSARAQDASTLWKNPAGLALLDGTQAQAGLQALYGQVKFKQTGPAPQGGISGGTAVGGLPGASFFISQKLNDNCAIG